MRGVARHGHNRTLPVLLGDLATHTRRRLIAVRLFLLWSLYRGPNAIELLNDHTSFYAYSNH